MAEKPIPFLPTRMLWPRLVRSGLLRLPSGSFVPPARVRKISGARAVASLVRSETLGRSVLYRAGSVVLSARRSLQVLSSQRIVPAATQRPGGASLRTSIFFAGGAGVGSNRLHSPVPVVPISRNERLRGAASGSEGTRRSAPGLTWQVLQTAMSGRQGLLSLKALPLVSLSKASALPLWSHQPISDGRSGGAVFPSRGRPVPLSPIADYRLFSAGSVSIAVQKRKGNQPQVDGEAAGPSGIIGRFQRTQGFWNQAGRHIEVSVVPDFAGALRRNHALTRQPEAVQSESDLLDRNRHPDGVMEMPRGQERVSALGDEGFRMNMLRTRSAVVDEIAMPQYPNMSFGFM